MAPDPLDMMFKAVADRTRLRLLNLLGDGEICVGDLVTIVDAPQPTVSRHLAHLRKAGLVEVHREANWCFYRLAAPRTGFHERLLDCIRCCFQEVPQLQKDARALARLKKRGGCCERQSAARPASTRACCR